MVHRCIINRQSLYMRFLIIPYSPKDTRLWTSFLWRVLQKRSKKGRLLGIQTRLTKEPSVDPSFTVKRKRITNTEREREKKIKSKRKRDGMQPQLFCHWFVNEDDSWLWWRHSSKSIRACGGLSPGFITVKNARLKCYTNQWLKVWNTNQTKHIITWNSGEIGFFFHVIFTCMFP